MLRDLWRTAADKRTRRRIQQAQRLADRLQCESPGTVRRFLIHVAHERIRRLQRSCPRYWRVGIIAGGTFELGRLNRRQAMAQTTASNLQIRFVDDEHAFIAANDPQSEAIEQ